MPRVSVIIPTYNRAGLVHQALNSVLAQTYNDFEIIVVDDGSTDNTGTVIQTMSDARLRYIFQVNQGPDAARNNGIQAALGDYIAFLDADDTYLPEKLAVQVDALDAQPEVGLVAGGHRFVNETGQPIADRRPWESNPQLDLSAWLYTCPITVNSVLVRREWLIRAGGFDLDLNGQAEDWDLWLRLAYLGCRMVWTPTIVCTYFVHSGQRIRDGESQKKSMFVLLDKFFAQFDLPAELVQQRSHVYATAYHSAAFREYAANQIDAAKHSLTQAIELEPELVTGDVPPLISTLVSWALDPLLGGPMALVERVLDNLPSSAMHLLSMRSRILFQTAIRAALDAILVGNEVLARHILSEVVAKESSLSDSFMLAVELLIDYVKTKDVERQVACIESFFDNLPPEFSGLGPYRRKALGRLFVARGFEAHAAGATWTAAQAIWQGAYLDPGWLRNRGIWSIMLRPVLPQSR